MSPNFITLEDVAGNDVTFNINLIARIEEEKDKPNQCYVSVGMERPTFLPMSKDTFLKAIKDEVKNTELAEWGGKPLDPSAPTSGKFVIYGNGKYVWRYYQTFGENGSSQPEKYATRFKTRKEAKEAIKVIKEKNPRWATKTYTVKEIADGTSQEG